ncbi:vWA domain-containing protein [Streptomyces prasinus]|uniref:vWA domain-containing protein n=1 Tax=Streptomyces prasinus TaxID=67345 RepID=UPI0033A26D05
MSEPTTPETRSTAEKRSTPETRSTTEKRAAAETRSTAEVPPTAGAPAASPGQGPAAGPATPETAVAALAAAGPGLPFLIGVRHHAPSLAAALPALLDEAAPDVLLVELPAEFQPWLGWLAHEETEAPVALAAVPADGPGPGPTGERGPAFYPFADFSPELVALRWAARNGVPAVACDLPLADRAWAGGRPDTPTPVPGADSAPMPGEGHGLSAALRSRLTGRDGDDLWDRLVEALAPGSTPEALRRAALLTGWALRHEAEARGGVHGTDLAREACMRGHVAEALASGRRPAVVVGAFHTPALLPSAAGADGAPVPDAPDASAAAPEPGADGHVNGAAGTAACTVSLVPYTYPLLDSRSGYPAGIRDPEWQHTVLDAAGDPAALHEALIRTAVRVCAALREQGHPYGPADGREVVRVAGDLARLRDLPAPGRGELLEAVQTVLGRGETYGTGRAVARALERVLVGARTGRPAPAAPRSGLGPAVEAETAALSLPGPEDAHEKTPRDLRLDPARSPLDRRRDTLLRRLTVCGIPYAREQGVTGAAGTEGLTTRWQVRWTPATAAMLTAAGARGVTPAQAAEGVLRQRHAAERAEDGPTADQVVRGLTEAAECGLPALADERLTELAAVLPASGTLPELLAGLDLLDRIDAGHLPGPAAPDDPSAPDASAAASARAARTARTAELLTSAAVRQVDGLTGSEDPEDARALLELAQRADRLGGIRLTDALARLAADGTPLIAAAAGAVRVLTGHEEAESFGGRVASWVDGAVDSTSRAALTARLTGVLTVAGPLLTVGVGALDPLLHRVVELDDTAFLARLPALRGGFDTLSPAARDRLLDTVEERLGERVDHLDADDPAEPARRTAADLAARALLTRLGLPVPPPPHDDRFPPLSGRPAATRPTGTPATAPTTAPCTGATPARTLAPADRWRLVLGRRPDRLPPGAARLATALDELYGAGHGEGSRSGLPGPGHGGGSGPRGGREPSFPGVREWSEELAALFGPGIREEVLAAAAATGRQDVLAALDPAAATPSVELLRTILRYAGGLPEARLAALRPLVRHLVDELTRQLATRLRPALTGTMSARPTRRPGGRLDLPRTLRANLATARRTADGTVRVIPEKPVFRSRVRRSADWRLILVTDVSGSMEASTIWSALTASVLAGVPTLSTHFLAFSTEVVDLTGHVHDPLSLLLEVSVGGGTHIAAGLRHARSLIAVPTRTLVVVISDFEEGAPLGGLLAEVRALVNTGCHVLGCASLDDAGRPRYSTGVAGQLVAAGMPVAALSPLELARWIGEKTA